MSVIIWLEPYVSVPTYWSWTISQIFLIDIDYIELKFQSEECRTLQSYEKNEE